MSTASQKPFYLMPESDPVVARYKTFFETTFNSGINSLLIDVPPEIVDGGYVELPQEIILVLQHYPQYIEKMIFALEFKFAQVADSDLYFQPLDWKSDPKYYRWFYKMGQFPLSLFFIHDAEARFYTFAGDLLADGKFDIVKHDQQRGKDKIAVTGEQVKLIYARLFTACFAMLVYCYGSGFDPKTVIESMMAEYNASFTYDTLYKQFMEDVKKGVNFFAKAQMRE